MRAAAIAGVAPDAPLFVDASAAEPGTDASPSLPPKRYRAIVIAVGHNPRCAILDDHRVSQVLGR
jgi:hypothetical protein